MLLALAALILVPAVVFAAAPTEAPTGVSATSGDGDMTLSWSSLNGASGGYDFRYANYAAGVFAATWHDVPGTNAQNNTSVTLPFGDPEQHRLTVGTTYYFQVRGKDSEDPANAGPASTPASEAQRATPSKLADVAATAGNTTVMLSWTAAPASDVIINYEIRQSDDEGSNWGAWSTIASYTTIGSTLSDTVTGLSNGTTYSFQIRAKNLQGGGPASETVVATPMGPPAAPAELTAQASSTEGTQVTLNWTDPSDSNIDKYQYRKRVSSAAEDAWDPNWTDIPLDDNDTTADTTDDFPGTEYTVTDLTEGTEYTFEVRAVDGDRAEGDQAGPESSVTATPTTEETTPAKMTNVQHVVTEVDEGKKGKVKFTWNNPGNSQIDKYQYRYDASGSNPDSWDVDWTDISPSDGATVSWGPFNIPGSSGPLFYQLRAVNNDLDESSTTDVNEGASLATAVTVQRLNTPGASPEPPMAPSGLTATPGLQSVTLSWTAPAQATRGYQVRKSTDGGASFDDWSEKFGGATTITYTVMNLTDGSTYTFELRAVAGTAEEPIYGAAAQAEAATPGAPNAPTALSGDADADEQITLTWTAGDAITDVTVTGFEYRKRASGDATWGDWTTIPDSGDGEANRSSYSVTGLDFGTAYEFQVRAVSASGNSQPSPTASATTITPPVPDKPTGLTATPGDDSVTLRWVNPANLTIDKYRYRKSESTDFALAPWNIIVGSGSGTTSHEVTGLTEGTLYYFQIQAGSPQGDSPDSDAVSARPAPVRGDWSFDAAISPGTLVTDNEDGATITFTATFTVTSGTATELSGAVDGTTPTMTATLSSGDGGKLGFGASLVETLGDNGDLTLDSTACKTNDAKTSVTCEYSISGLFAKTNATPGSYTIAVALSGDDISFKATASTAAPDDFNAGEATKADIGADGTITVSLQVNSGLPAAPENLSAAGGNSLVTLSWDDPDNAGISGYEYRQTTDVESTTLSWSADADATGWEYRRSQDGGTNWDPNWTAIPGSDVDPRTFNTFEITGANPDVDSFEVRPVKAAPNQPKVDPITVAYTASAFPATWNSITGHVVRGLVNNEWYDFQLRAVTPAPDGGPGPEATSGATSLVAGPPAKPEGFTAVPSDEITEVNLAWTTPDPAITNLSGWEYQQTTSEKAVLTWTVDPADATITGWEYQQETDGGWTSISPDFDDTTTYTFVIRGLDPNLEFTFQVRPVRDDVPGGAVTTLTTPEVVLDFDNFSPKPIAGSGTTSHRVTDLNLIDNTYFFQVRPVTDPRTDQDPVDALTLKYLGTVTLSWTNPKDSTINDYQYSQDSGGSWTDIDPSDATTVTHEVLGLTALSVDSAGGETETVYGFQVRAVNGAGEGTPSDIVSANPGIPLAAPADVNVSYDPASTTFTVSWDAHAVTTADFEVRGTDPNNGKLSETGAAGETSVDILTDLFGQFSFDVLVRENYGPWSDPVNLIGIANPFGEGPITREIDENVPAGSDVGKPVEVAVTGFTVTYSMGGRDFSIDSFSGQISLTGGTPAPGAYPVLLTANLSKEGVSSSFSTLMTINVTTMDPWVQLAIQRAPKVPGGTDDDAQGYELGNSVAVDGDTGVLVAGAPGVDDGTASDVGAAYVFERPGDYSPAKLTARTPTADEKFGNSVAVDGDTVVVGTSADNVYVFTKPPAPAGWSDSNTPTATLTRAGEGFGGSVAISRNTIFVGAKGTDTSPGAVYVFVKAEGDNWAESTTAVATLTALNGVNGDGFGSRVMIEGDDLVVVASGAQAVYYFAKSADGWAIGSETAKLTATEEGDWFGALSADIDGDTIVVGTTQIESGVDSGSGAVYVFTGSGSEWTQDATFTALGGDPGDGFGKDVQISGDVIAAGRRNQADNDRASSVQVFKKPSGGWDSSIVPSVLLASDGEADDLFGHAVALDGKLMVVGALGEDTRGDNAGAAYVFSSVTRPNVSRGVLEVVHPYSEPTVTGPNGITQVTIPGGAVPTGTGSFWRFVRFSGCTGVPGGTVHDCISVQLYDLDANPVRFNQDTLLDDEAEVTLSRPSGVFTVRKGDSWTNSWRTVPPCSTVATGECYTVEGNTIVVSGITSFSQFAVTKASRPGAPTELRVSLGNRQVDLTWTAPSTTGGSAIRGYDYSTDRGATWTRIPGSDASTTAFTVTGLQNGTRYSFAVRARNSAGSGPRSNIVEATPGSRGRDVSPGRARGGSATSHVPPTFDEGASTTRQIAENSPTGTRIGGPLVARDPLERRVLYTKGGPDADLFDVASQTGQIYVRRGTVLDYESGRKTFLIEVVGNTGVGGPARISVTIIVTNVPEPGSVVLSPDTPPEVGAEIKAALSDPDSGINGVNWQWQRSSDGRTWNDIPSATSASYTPTEADRGMMLRVSVRYNDAAAAGINLASMATGPVTIPTPPLPLDRPGSVTLSPDGAPEVGTEITATITDPDGGVTGETWQWQRSADGVTWTAIEGASSASYTPAEADVGMMLRANVSYSDAAAAGVSLLSATTEAVAEMPAPDRPGSVTLSPEGTPEIGNAITATVTDPDGEVTGEIWQWQRSADGVTWTDIDGATTERYTPTEADAGMVLRANVSYNDAVATGVNAMGINTEAVAVSPAPDLETPTPTPTPPSPLVRPDTPTPPPTPVVPPQTSTPTQTMLPTPPPTDVPPTPTAITSEVTPTEAPTTPVTPEEEGGFPAWLIIVIIIGAVIIIAGIIIIVRSRMQQ